MKAEIDWLIALRHISTLRLLVPRNVTKLDMIKICRRIQLCMKIHWLAGLMTHQYKKQPVTMKCGCSLTSCPGHHSVRMQFNVMPRTRKLKWEFKTRTSFHSQMGNTRWQFTININISFIELKWDGKKIKYDMITRWGEYE